MLNKSERLFGPRHMLIIKTLSVFFLRVMQRKQSLGKPDQKDLNENLAATQGLAHMIAECKKLFQVTIPARLGCWARDNVDGWAKVIDLILVPTHKRSFP